MRKIDKPLIHCQNKMENPELQNKRSNKEKENKDSVTKGEGRENTNEKTLSKKMDKVPLGVLYYWSVIKGVNNLTCHTW